MKYGLGGLGGSNSNGETARKRPRATRYGLDSNDPNVRHNDDRRKKKANDNYFNCCLTLERTHKRNGYFVPGNRPDSGHWFSLVPLREWVLQRLLDGKVPTNPLTRRPLTPNQQREIMGVPVTTPKKEPKKNVAFLFSPRGFS